MRLHTSITLTAMSSLPQFPYILLDVAEKIIDQLNGDNPSLRSCTLTSRGWHPRARYHLMASIRIRSREDLSSIYDYFCCNPLLAGVVRNLSIAPDESESNPLFLLQAIPVFLLSRLPNIRRYSIGHRFLHTGIALHNSTLKCINTYLHVEELGLGPLSLRTLPELARLFIALPQARLGCTDLNIRPPSATTAVGTNRFRDRCRLSEVDVGHPLGTWYAVAVRD